MRRASASECTSAHATTNLSLATLRHDVGLAAGHRQPARHLAGHLLGRARSELLVDVLPAVELDEQHGQRAPGALGAGQGGVELLLDQRTVGRLGERRRRQARGPRWAVPRGATAGAGGGRAAPPGPARSSRR